MRGYRCDAGPRPLTDGHGHGEVSLTEVGWRCEDRPPTLTSRSSTDGRARFIVDQPRAPKELPDHRYPFVLLTGRGTTSQWHTQTRTGRSAVLRGLYPADAYVEVHPIDADDLDLHSGDEVRIESRRGAMSASVFVNPTVQPGQLFVPMHYPETNQLTFPAVDPHSRQPSYKHCAVRIRRPEHWERR